MEAGPEPTVPAGLLATHPDRCLQLSHELVIDSLCHLRLQLVKALVTVSESLVAGGKEKRQRWGSSNTRLVISHQLLLGHPCPPSQDSGPRLHRPGQKQCHLQCQSVTADGSPSLVSTSLPASPLQSPSRVQVFPPKGESQLVQSHFVVPITSLSIRRAS